jgi:hypothetical protein
MKKRKIYGVYFVALMNDWFPIVNHQIRKLFNSDLFLKTDKLFIRVFYRKNEDLVKFKKMMRKDRKIIIEETKNNEYEFGALRKIKELSKEDNFYCYYLHAKGVSRTSNKPVSKCISSWREYMEYFLIDKFELCIKELDNGWDAAGVKLRRTPKTNFFHFSGNFWWTKSEFVKVLPEINSLNLTKRHDAEFWIGYTNGKLKCIHDTTQAGLTTIVTENYKNL